MIKKVMLKQKSTKISRILRVSPIRTVSLIAIALVLAAGSFIHLTRVSALSTQEQIQALEQENANNRSAVANLRNQAVSYQDAIAKLEAQIGYLQGQIDANTAEQNRLQQEITEAEAELARQKSILSQNVRAIYYEGQISTLEMLASSKDLSEFVDKQEYRNSVQAKIKDAMERITKLRFELSAKKEAVSKLLAQQQDQQAELSDSRAEQSNLLSFNQNQQAEFNQKTKDNQAKISALIASQRRANNATDGGFYFLRFPGNINDFDGRDYPYRTAGFSMQLGPCSLSDSYPDSPDRWGYCTRQCVSYAAWAVEASGRSAPMYYGNAKDWKGEAERRGIPVYRAAQPGDVAISTSGQWGHAMYVEEVSGNKARVSEYNQQLDGNYRNDRWISF